MATFGNAVIEITNQASAAIERQLRRSAGIKPADCPHCEYDRRFPGFESGGWIQQDNNGPIVPCPLCNDAMAHPRPSK